MNVASQIQHNYRLKRHRSWLIISGTILMISNLLLSLYITNLESRTIVVPTYIPKEISLTNKHVSEEYLELMARDVINMILNITPHSYEYVESYLLKLSHPSHYGKLKQELMELAEDIKMRDVSISFFITHMTVDVSNLKVAVEGHLETRVGLKTVNRELRKYNVVFDYTGARFSIKDFYEVENE